MLEKMKEMIADQLSVDEDKITLESNFKDDLDADSLDLFELVMAGSKSDFPGWTNYLFLPAYRPLVLSPLQ